MKIEVFKVEIIKKWRWRIISKTNRLIAVSDNLYSKKCHALDTAKAIAGRRMKVVVCE